MGKRVADVLFAVIELFSLGVTAQALRANIDWKSICVFKGGWSVTAKF